MRRKGADVEGEGEGKSGKEASGAQRSGARNAKIRHQDMSALIARPSELCGIIGRVRH